MTLETMVILNFPDILGCTNTSDENLGNGSVVVKKDFVMHACSMKILSPWYADYVESNVYIGFSCSSARVKTVYFIPICSQLRENIK